MSAVQVMFGVRRRTWWHLSHAARDVSIMFRHLLPGPVIGRQAYRIPPLTTKAWEERKIVFEEKIGRVWPNAELSERAKCTRECVLRQFWKSFVDDRFDLGNAIQTKTEFSSAIAVMDKIGGWEERTGWDRGSRQAFGIYTKAVICNGQKNMQDCKLQQFRSIMKAVNWVCDDALDDHVRVSELTISCREAKVLEALQYNLANPCMVQWGMLWVLGTNKSQSEIFEQWSDP